MLKVRGKQSNENKIKGYPSKTDFIGRVKGLCFPLCFPLCFQRDVGAGKVKVSNETKLKSKRTNEEKIKVKVSNEHKLKVKQENL